MKCIIAGSRHVHDRATLDAAIQTCPFASRITSVVCGGAPGVDLLGDKWAWQAELPVHYFIVLDGGAYPWGRLLNVVSFDGALANVEMVADWQRDGKKAGPIRNRKMAEYADALIAVPLAGDRKGTDSMLAEATRRGLLIHVREVTHG